MTAGPRQRLTADERRDQLVAAAVEVLAEVGFRGATADAIARRAGVSKGLLWHYFADRDDLLEQTARRTLVRLREAVGAMIDLTAPAPEVIRAAVHGAVSLRGTHGAERRAMNEIVLNLRAADGSLRLGLHDYDDTYAAQAEIFRRGQVEGDVRADLDALLLAVTYQGAVDSMLGHLDAHPEADAARHADTVADVLLGESSRKPRHHGVNGLRCECRRRAGGAAMTDSSTVQRFVEAQDTRGTYDDAVTELRAGHKTSHWIWFVFPQLAGLGRSVTAQEYAIASLDEARTYLAHPVLGPRLRECVTVLLELPATATADGVLGPVDAMKLRSSMTLFARAAPAERSFRRVLGRYFAGEPDRITERLLAGGMPRTS